MARLHAIHNLYPKYLFLNKKIIKWLHVTRVRQSHKSTLRTFLPIYMYLSLSTQRCQGHLRVKAPVWVVLQIIYQKGAVLKLFIEGICFYLYCTKGRGIIQRGADMWHWVVVPKVLRNGLLQLQWRNHFWTGYVSVCWLPVLTAFGSVWPVKRYCAMSIGATLCSNDLSTT